MPNEATDSLYVKSAKTGGGNQYGQSTSDKIGFYGTTPIAQYSQASQAAITDGSGGTAAATNGVQPCTGSYNSTILNNTVATILSQTNALRRALVTIGLIAGS